MSTSSNTHLSLKTASPVCYPHKKHSIPTKSMFPLNVCGRTNRPPLAYPPSTPRLRVILWMMVVVAAALPASDSHSSQSSRARWWLTGVTHNHTQSLFAVVPSPGWDG